MSTNVPNLKQIGGGHRKNGQKFVDLMWNDPGVLHKMKTPGPYHTPWDVPTHLYYYRRAGPEICPHKYVLF